VIAYTPQGKAKKLTDAGNEVGIEENVEKTTYMLLSPHQNAGQNHDIKTGNRTFENVAQFKYLGTAVTNQNPIQEDIKGNVCCHSMQGLVFSSAF
jgi:hypothetical protein